MRRFARLSATERSLLPRLVVLVAITRLALWLVPFSLVRTLFKQQLVAVAFPPARLRLQVDRLAWAVEVASRPIPAASCLTQSLVLQFLLAQAGHVSSVQIGVAKDDSSGFQAHAWVECADRVLLDRPESVACYKVLATLEAL
jgi:hypothetical protein